MMLLSQEMAALSFFPKDFLHTNYRAQRGWATYRPEKWVWNAWKEIFEKDSFKLLSDEQILKKQVYQSDNSSTSVKSQKR